MNLTSKRIEVERKQRNNLFQSRDRLWALAQRGYAVTGRGLIVADGKGTGPHVSVSWRSGHTLLSGSADAVDWIRRSADMVRRYDPAREFVLQYLSPNHRVHIYRVAVRPDGALEE